MNQFKNQYVKAAATALETGADFKATMKRLRDSMARRGHLRLLPGVLDGLLNTFEGKTEGVPRLTVAKAEDAELYPELARQAEVEIDPNIVGGYIFTRDHRRIDQSYKTRLRNWYKAAVN